MEVKRQRHPAHCVKQEGGREIEKDEAQKRIREKDDTKRDEAKRGEVK